MSRIVVSVIIPTHNRREGVLRAVAALAAQDYSADSYEIIVSCDRCIDGTKEALQASFGDRLKVIDSTSPGQAGALNMGLKRAAGEIAIFIDDEMEPERGFISAHVQAHKSLATEKLVVVGYSVVVLSQSLTPMQRQLASSYELFHHDLEQQGRQFTPLDINGANFSSLVSAILGVGGFDESYFFQRNDFELAIRLLLAGYEFRFCRAARAKLYLAINTNTIIRRAAERARNDYRLACEYPWCIPYLPFYRALHDVSVRRRWWILWKMGPSIVAILSAARRVMPENLRLVNWHYAARYCLGLSHEIGEWSEFCRLRHKQLEV
jgi:GT2 family glycosyltransferase